MFKNHFNCALWLGILNLPLACFFGLAYLPDGDSPWFVLCTFFFALIGQLFVYFAIASIILIFPVFNWRKKIGWPSLIYATCIIAICHGLLNIDSNLYENYGQHLLTYLHQTHDRDFDWTAVNWMHFGMQFIIIIGYSSLILVVARSLSNHHSIYWPFALVILIMYFLSSGIFMFAQSRNVEPLIELESKNLPKFIDIRRVIDIFRSPDEQEGSPALPPAQYEPDDGSHIQPSAKWNDERTETTPNVTPDGGQEAEPIPEQELNPEQWSDPVPQNRPEDQASPGPFENHKLVQQSEQYESAEAPRSSDSTEPSNQDAGVIEAQFAGSEAKAEQEQSSAKASGFGIATSSIK